MVETRIAAPIERCFDLARDLEAHVKTASFTGERLVTSRTFMVTKQLELKRCAEGTTDQC